MFRDSLIDTRIIRKISDTSVRLRPYAHSGGVISSEPYNEHEYVKCKSSDWERPMHSKWGGGRDHLYQIP